MAHSKDSEDKGPLIDSSELLKKRGQKKVYRLIQPTLEKFLGISFLNDAYAQNEDLPPLEFAERMLAALGFHYSFDEEKLEKLRQIEGPLVFVSNHPFGGPEAIFMILLMAKIRDNFKVMANYLFEKVKEVEPNLMLVDPFGGDDATKRNKAALMGTLRYLIQDGFLGIFPSGEVASYNIRTRRIQEPEWNANVARLIQMGKATVVPVYFHGTNSLLFHAAGVLNPKLRTSLLIREFVRPSRNRLHYQIGEIIPPSKIKQYASPEELIQYLKSRSYLLAMRYPARRVGLRLRRRRKRRHEHVPEAIMEAIPTDLLLQDIQRLQELDKRLFDQKEFEVYLFEAQEAPNLLRELGRQREITFRAVGEGTGEPLDLSDHDMYYEHLLIWDREHHQIVGAYRIGRVDKIVRELGRKWLYISTSFHIKKEFFDDVKPILELSRAIVTEPYQRSFYPLMMLWMGIGQYVRRNPHYRYLMGSLSISADFHEASKEFMVAYLEERYQLKHLMKYVKPRNTLSRNPKWIEEHYNHYNIQDINSVQELINGVEKSEKKIPVLLRQYLRLGAKAIDFNVDPAFNNALDILILTDMHTANIELMTKHMTPEGYAEYREVHGLPPLQEASEGDSQAAGGTGS